MGEKGKAGYVKRSASPRVVIGGVFIVVALIFGLLISAVILKRPQPASTQAPNPPPPVTSASGPSAAPAAPLVLANLARIDGDTYFFVDSVNETSFQPPPPMPIKIKGGAPITLSGWAVDNATANVAGGVILAVDETMTFPANYGIDRPDITAALKSPVFQRSGFSVTIPPNALAVGKHTLTIKIVTTDRKSYYAPAQKIDIEIA
jgi:hypothetical protein